MSPLSDKRVLVTGGAGFIGSHLARRLTPDADVVVLDSLENGDPGAVPADTTLLEADLRDTDALAEAMVGVDVVFHQAALVSIGASVSDPTTSHVTNVDGTIAVLEAARDADARAVLASSAAIYGDPETVPIPESAPKQPQSPYGLEKLTVDHYARLYHDLYGLETVALRYFNVYGPGQRGGDYSGVIDVFLEQARRNEPITVHGAGTQTRDFVHVDDVVEANCLAATTDRVGKAYNVATGDAVSVRELAELIRKVTGSDSEIVHTDPREGDVERSRADLSNVRERLGYEPSISLEEGLRELASARDAAVVDHTDGAD
ncbi:NAD-dependent epimerase/dehydratase family protein [Natrarchaeobaculum sulfurireducens]|uniref:UDP-glucose 4-epimerase n=1 Tax=Natrarchaeobaculum sulfurireducens TaxID=2044521 RepID=A0A346PNX2_9EURY|nr:NAD-dependent epimerase/dehydratase family protein [Natrarchaeobaculum sulfurireducens]AXR81217.1 UDP-glucose 4-epimerase [Natrarchaeobaculum sulfurireducens]